MPAALHATEIHPDPQPLPDLLPEPSHGKPTVLVNARAQPAQRWAADDAWIYRESADGGTPPSTNSPEQQPRHGALLAEPFDAPQEGRQRTRRITVQDQECLESSHSENFCQPFSRARRKIYSISNRNRYLSRCQKGRGGDSLLSSHWVRSVPEPDAPSESVRWAPVFAAFPFFALKLGQGRRITAEESEVRS